MTMNETISVKSRTVDAKTTAKTRARARLCRAIGFQDCSPSTLDELVACAQVRELEKGECVSRRGEPLDSLGILVDGVLEISLTHNDGHRHIVSLMQPGDIYGLISVLDGLGHSHDVWARSRSVLLQVPKASLLRLRGADPQLVLACERQLLFRSRLLYERLASNPSVPLVARVSRLLHMLGTLHGVPRGNGFELDMRLSQTDLADWLGISRQRINFVLKELEDNGVIALRYSGVTIADRDKLEEWMKG